MAVRMILHFVRRILRYDAPLAAVGAIATWSETPSGSDVSTGAVVAALAIRFVVIACTAGYGLSFLLYVYFGRRELPLYLVFGRHVPWFAAISYGVVFLGLCSLLTIGLLLMRWMKL